MALLAAMVLVPLGALGWLGARFVQQQDQLARHQVTTLLEDRLREVDASVQRFVDERQRELLRVAAAVPTGTERIRAWLATLPRGADVLVVDLEGRVSFPPLGAPLSQSESELLERTKSVWDGDGLQTEARRARTSERPGVGHGWYGYFHGGGLSLLLWRADGDRIVGVELPRIALLSDLVAYLPATTSDDARTPSRTTLTDESGTPVYQWGGYEPPPNEPARAVFTLSPPLSAWSLRHYSPESALPGGLGDSIALNLALGLLAVGLALVGLALYLFRVRTREMRVAAQRVSFVNQVSHELKTPLTNIRLYAELLADTLGFDDADLADAAPADPAARHLGVITSESQRLSRLISNVLTFARGQEGRLSVNTRPGTLDDVVRAVGNTFGPSLEHAGVDVVLALAAPERVLLDADAVEQILANLLSNVEKYARGGKVVRVTTARVGDVSTVHVADEGPGIPPSQREKAFEPFHRLDDRLSEGATGTGIGLDIARQLARLHGGDLRLLDSECGATFAVTLYTPPVKQDTP